MIPWFYMSFADSTLSEGSQFLGALYVQAESMECAVTASHLSGLNPGGEIQIVKIPEGYEPAQHDRGRLLSADEARKSICMPTIS